MKNMVKKREISPHKGGRTARFECRIDPDIKEYIKARAEEKECSMADIIEEWAEKEKKGLYFVRTN